MNTQFSDQAMLDEIAARMKEFRSLLDEREKLYREVRAMRTMLKMFAGRIQWLMNKHGSRSWISEFDMTDREVRELCELAERDVPPEVGT